MFSITLLLFFPFYAIFSKPDFVIIEPNFPILSFIPVLPLFRSKKIKLFLDIRSTPVETFGIRGFLRSFYFNMSVLVAKKLFNGITIITPLMKEEVCRKFSLNPNSVGVWSSGVNKSLFNSEYYAFEAQDLKKKLELSQKFIVFYHGAFSANRGLTQIIEAIYAIKNTVPDVVLFLLGTGSIIEDLKKLIIVKGLQKNIVIHNSVKYTEVPKYIAIADICIVPLPNNKYWRFQCPLNLLEYLAMGKMTIATDIPANRLVIGEQKCVIYLSSVEPIEIAEAIEYAYRNKEKLKEWGSTGRKLIEENYTWEKVAKDLQNYLISVDKKVPFTAKFRNE
ncbi:MAG: glycosyltransferase family 4 protein [Candidatus Bathyarchaeia archaeon]